MRPSATVVMRGSLCERLKALSDECSAPEGLIIAVAFQAFMWRLNRSSAVIYDRSTPSAPVTLPRFEEEQPFAELLLTFQA